MVRSKIISLLLTLLAFIYLFPFCTGASIKYRNVPRVEDIPYLQNALHEGLLYINCANSTKTLDVALGMMLVKASLQWVGNHLMQGYSAGGKYLGKISELLELSKGIFFDLSRSFEISGNPRMKKFHKLLEYIFDEIAAEDLKYGDLAKNNIRLPISENCSIISDYFLKGTPNNSDSCIMELFDKSCDISPSCWFQEMNHLENAGYRTSHRLLYLQLAMKLKCSLGDEMRMKTMKTSMCQRMLDEAIALYGKNVFFARDLFLEQIALCGFEGHSEFADRAWSVQIPRWQLSNGCFGILPGENIADESSCSEWRTDVKERSDPCSAHLTAVAVSALAFHLRVAFDQF